MQSLGERSGKHIERSGKPKGNIQTNSFGKPIDKAPEKTQNFVDFLGEGFGTLVKSLGNQRKALKQFGINPCETLPKHPGKTLETHPRQLGKPSQHAPMKTREDKASQASKHRMPQKILLYLIRGTTKKLQLIPRKGHAPIFRS